MVMTFNRQISAGFNQEKQQGISLRFLKDEVFQLKSYKKGDIVEVPRSVARRLMLTRKDLFTVSMD